MLGLAVNVPGKAIGAALALMTKNLSEEKNQVLTDYHSLVVQSLRSVDDKALQQQLESDLPGLKAVAGLPICADAND